jgi:hypothetical protein
MKKILLAIFAMLIPAMFGGTAAHAQATRTWVSGVGDDVNPCSRTAPCKTFAGAISKTAAGGEINCLDPGGFGAVTINKSLTINCIYTEGGALAGGNGIVVNAGATDVVVLRGLDIFGVNPPTNGIRFIAGATLIVEDCTIRRFNAASSFGISFQPSGASTLIVNRTTLSTNGNGGTGGGILVQPTGVSGSARVFLNNVNIHANANIGVSVNTTGASSGNGTTVAIENSQIIGNATGISILQPGGTQNVLMSVNQSAITHNTSIGVTAAGAGTIARFDNTTITANGLGISSSSGAQLLSYGGNRLDGNPAIGAPADGAFTGPAVRK